MNLVKAISTDYDFAREMHHTAYRDMVIRQYGEWDVQVQDEFFEQTWESHPHLIIREEGLACGYCCIEENDLCIQLHEIAIHPEHQGRGIGSAVIHWIINNAKDKSLSVELNVMKSNANARALYERLGFKRVGESETHFNMSICNSGKK